MRKQVLLTEAIRVFRQFNGVYLNFFTAAALFFTVKESHEMAMDAVKKYNSDIQDRIPANDRLIFTEDGEGWVLEYFSNSGKHYRVIRTDNYDSGTCIVEWDENSSFAPEFEALEEAVNSGRF